MKAWWQRTRPGMGRFHAFAAGEDRAIEQESVCDRHVPLRDSIIFTLDQVREQYPRSKPCVDCLAVAT